MNRQSLLHIALAGFLGTSVMTVFSYILSHLSADNFREPQLLGKLLQGTLLPINSPISRPAGWVCHYSFGLGLATVFHNSWKHRENATPVLSGLIAGACSGTAAVIWWHNAFRLHPHPPLLRHDRFYLQLFIAHMLYSITVAETIKER